MCSLTVFREGRKGRGMGGQGAGGKKLSMGVIKWKECRKFLSHVSP